MKTKNRFPLFLIAIAWTGFAEAQVTIPANSATSLDRETSVATDTVTALPPLGGSAFSNSSNVSRVQPPANPITTQKATVTTSTKPAKDRKLEGSKVTAIQRVKPITAPQSVATIKRLSELRQELNIAVSASRARIVLPADELFEASDSTIINRFSIPVLKKISEYLLLSDKKKITLSSYYAPDQEDGKPLAWGRSLSLIEWLEDAGGLPADSINTSRPAPVKSKTQKEFPNTPGERAFQNRIELNLE